LGLRIRKSLGDLRGLALLAREITRNASKIEFRDIMLLKQFPFDKLPPMRSESY